MILVFFFGFVAALVCGAAISGFVLALYIFRPQHLGDLLHLLPWSAQQTYSPNPAAIGLILAAAMPVIAGLSYAVSGTRWFAEFFGLAGTYFWAWVAVSFAVGFMLGLLLRGEVSR